MLGSDTSPDENTSETQRLKFISIASLIRSDKNDDDFYDNDNDDNNNNDNNNEYDDNDDDDDDGNDDDDDDDIFMYIWGTLSAAIQLSISV